MNIDRYIDNKQVFIWLCLRGLTANGPAIKGGCVTRREHRADPGTLAAKQSRCQEGMARVFAVMVRCRSSITSVAVQS
jgi:hypothetical protein